MIVVLGLVMNEVVPNSSIIILESWVVMSLGIHALLSRQNGRKKINAGSYL